MLTYVQVDWQKATTDFGSASVESMKVMTRYAIKKMEKATGKEGEEPKAARGGASKRKGKGDGNDAEPKPKKSRGKKAKGEIPKAEGKHSLRYSNADISMLTSLADGVAADGEALIKDEGGELD